MRLGNPVLIYRLIHRSVSYIDLLILFSPSTPAMRRYWELFWPVQIPRGIVGLAWRLFVSAFWSLRRHINQDKITVSPSPWRWYTDRHGPHCTSLYAMLFTMCYQFVENNYRRIKQNRNTTEWLTDLIVLRQRKNDVETINALFAWETTICTALTGRPSLPTGHLHSSCTTKYAGIWKKKIVEQYMYIDFEPPVIYIPRSRKAEDFIWAWC